MKQIFTVIIDTDEKNTEKAIHDALMFSSDIKKIHDNFEDIDVHENHIRL